MSPSPLSVRKNNYIKKPKRQDIETPMEVCHFLYRIITNSYKIRTILDPCCGRGNLIKPFVEKDKTEVYAFDIKGGTNFLEYDKKLKVDLVLCNPPFNLGVGRKLGSEVFLEKIIKVVGSTTPIVLYVPMGFLLNQRKKSKRWRRLRDEFPPITSIVSLPLDIFEKVQFHAEVLLFNTSKLKPHYFLDI